MGYSYSAMAGHTLDAIEAHFQTLGVTSSNGTPDGGFFETGRENDNGAITGTVWRKLNAQERARWSSLDNLDGRVIKRGSFKIDPNGKVIRFPGLPQATARECEANGLARYRELYDTSYDYKDHAKSLAAMIAASRNESNPPANYWDAIQHIASEHQKAKSIPFLVMPELNAGSMIDFLNALSD